MCDVNEVDRGMEGSWREGEREREREGGRMDGNNTGRVKEFLVCCNLVSYPVTWVIARLREEKAENTEKRERERERERERW